MTTHLHKDLIHLLGEVKNETYRLVPQTAPIEGINRVNQSSIRRNAQKTMAFCKL